MEFFDKTGVTTGDTFEIAYAHNEEKYWNEDSIYFPDEENGIGILAPHLDKVFGIFAYYGIQRVDLNEWKEVEKLCKTANPNDQTVTAFFEAVEEWLEKGNRGKDYFWIYGI